MKTSTLRAIEAHGQRLLAIFPNATERDSIELYYKLRRIERRAAKIGECLCVDPEYSEEKRQADRSKIESSISQLLGDSPAIDHVFVNQDPRGYALKINNAYVRSNNIIIYEDWGGFGILAPEIK